MNIILGEERARALASKYVVLPLDTFLIENHETPVQSFCVIEQMPVSDLSQLESWVDLHNNLMVNYQKKNWNYCQQAIEHLIGRWNGELDTFYINLQSRISNYIENDPGPDWSSIITR